MGEPLRIRHGVMFDPILGYRAIREWNGERTFIGPWTTEDNAQANADETARIAHEVIDAAGLGTAPGDTPLGLRVPGG